jgi:tetratricopeptide (TPR) repeat protein
MGNDRFEPLEQRQQSSQGDRTNKRLIADSTLPGESDPEVRDVLRKLSRSDFAAVAPDLKKNITPDMYVTNHSNYPDGKLQRADFQNKDGSIKYSIDVSYVQGGNAPGKPEDIYEERNRVKRHTHITYSEDGQINNREVDIDGRKVSYWGTRLNGPKISEYEVTSHKIGQTERTSSPTSRDNVVAWDDPHTKDDSRKTVARKRTEVEPAQVEAAATTKPSGKTKQPSPLEDAMSSYYIAANSHLAHPDYSPAIQKTEAILAKDPKNDTARLFHAFSKVGERKYQDAANDYNQLLKSKDPTMVALAKQGIANAGLTEQLKIAQAAEAKAPDKIAAKPQDKPIQKDKPAEKIATKPVPKDHEADKIAMKSQDKPVHKDKDADKIAMKPADTITGKVIDKTAEQNASHEKQMAANIAKAKKDDAVVQKYLKKYPLDAAAWAKLGKAQFELRHYEEANKDFNQAILLARKHADKSANPLDARFWIDKGKNDEKLKNYQEANLDYNSALRLSDDNKASKDYKDAMKAYLDLKQTIVVNKTKDASKVSDTNPEKKNKST